MYQMKPWTNANLIELLLVHDKIKTHKALPYLSQIWYFEMEGQFFWYMTQHFKFIVWLYEWCTAIGKMLSLNLCSLLKAIILFSDRLQKIGKQFW